jgi:hypothetical protein
MAIGRIYQLFSFQGLPKFTKIWIFGLKTNHLATLVVDPKFSRKLVSDTKPVNPQKVRSQILKVSTCFAVQAEMQQLKNGPM